MAQDSVVAITPANPAGQVVLVRDIPTDVNGVQTIAEMQVVAVNNMHGAPVVFAGRAEQEIQTIAMQDARADYMQVNRGRTQLTDRRGSLGHRGTNR